MAFCKKVASPTKNERLFQLKIENLFVCIGNVKEISKTIVNSIAVFS